MTPTIFWAPKGGVGCTTVAVAAAVIAADQGPTILVDLTTNHEAQTVMGLGRVDPVPAITELSSLVHSVRPVTKNLSLLDLDADAVERRLVLAELVAADHDHAVIVDLGTTPAYDESVAAIVGESRYRTVVSNCYLSLRAAAAVGHTRSVVLVNDSTRALDRDDVREVCDPTSLWEVPRDPAVARAVDAGLLPARLPRGLQHDYA